jgi:hypothetical protein
MSPLLHLNAGSLEVLFHMIGSADHGLLRELGVEPGGGFLTATEDEEDPFYEAADAEEPFWGDDEEADSAREVIVNIIMGGMPADLSETEAYAIQDFMASYATRSEGVHAIEGEDVLDAVTGKLPPEVANEMQAIVIKGIDLDAVLDFVDWLQSKKATNDLVFHLQMLCFGRLPESEEPTFPDIEDSPCEARFGYLCGKEMGQIAGELAKWASKSPKDMKAVAYAMSGAFKYCVDHSQDLVVTIEE